MKKNILKTAAILLILMTGFLSCGKENEEISPCNGTDIDYANTIMIENLQTKLYFLIPYPGFAPQVVLNPSNGIAYRKSVNSAVLNLQDYKGRALCCDICNFPEFVLKWNPQNKANMTGDSMIEGELDVTISGKIYVSVEEDNTVLGTLELTAIKK